MTTYNPAEVERLIGYARRFMPADLSKDNLSAMADQLEAARAEIERLGGDVRTVVTNFRQEQREHVQTSLQMRELEQTVTSGNEAFLRARESWSARIAQLEETARAAAENWMSACRQRDEARVVLRGVRTGLRALLGDAPAAMALWAELDRVLGEPTPSPDPAAPGPRPAG